MSLGLCLAGGGIKGAAHIGALKAIEENNIKIDYIGGTSSGSIIATLYACGFTSAEIYEIFKTYCKKVKYVQFNKLFKLIFGLSTSGKISITGFNSGNVISKLINSFCNKKGVYDISDIQMPLVVPSVNMHTGDVICFTSSNFKRAFSNDTIFINHGDIGKVVQASCSFPSVFCPCTFQNMQLIDGGVRENVPWREVKSLGAEKVLSIVFENEVDKKCCKNFIDVTFRSFELMCKELSKYEFEGSDYLVTIKSKKISLLDFKKVDYLYELGYLEMKKRMSEFS